MVKGITIFKWDSINLMDSKLRQINKHSSHFREDQAQLQSIMATISLPSSKKQLQMRRMETSLQGRTNQLNSSSINESLTFTLIRLRSFIIIVKHENCFSF